MSLSKFFEIIDYFWKQFCTCSNANIRSYTGTSNSRTYPPPLSPIPVVHAKIRDVLLKFIANDLAISRGYQLDL